MTTPGAGGPGHDDADHEELGRSVDTAVGSSCDRAFDLLDDIKTDNLNSCVCQRCRTRKTMLHLVLGRELRRVREQQSTDT